MSNHTRVFSVILNLFVTLSLLVGSAIFPSAAQAASVITVATNADTIAADGLCSLREAIINADNDTQTHNDCVGGSGNDTILFNDGLGASTITLGDSLPTITDLDGLTINGGGDITISGANLYTILFVMTDVPLTLSSVILADGNCPGSCGPGGIGSSGILTITNSTFTGINHTAINNLGTVNITDSTFSGNTTDFDASSIYNWSGATLNITNSTFSGNTTTYRGTIYNTGSANITKSTFSGNSSSNSGSVGAIYNQGTLTITNSSFSANSGSNGNSAGAVYNNGAATITNSTFSANSISGFGGAADIYHYGSTSSLNLYNNILANSTGGDCLNDFSAGPVIGSNNLIEDSSTACGLTNGTNGNIIGFDPNLGALIGSPSYFPLNTGSPALNAGDDATCAAPPMNNTSQNGITRPQGTHCDMGSFEKDLTPPSVSSSVRIDSDPTTLASVHFTVTFSEPVTGVDAGDMGVITTGAISGVSIMNVSGSDSTYTVTVNTGNGNGTIRLDIFNNLSIQDLAGNSLSGGDFNTGESYTVNKTVILSRTLNSQALNDGWILESTETSGKGGTLNSTATNFLLGDDLADRQYRALLHFDTSFLPDTAVITSATLKIKKQGQSGSNPFTILGNLRVDMRKPAFGTAALALTDFKSAAGQNNVSTFGVTPVANWYSAILNGTGNSYINRTGTTQFRLYFTTDDNNDNGNDFMKFYSGNAGAVQRPQLIIEYYVP